MSWSWGSKLAALASTGPSTYRARDPDGGLCRAGAAAVRSRARRGVCFRATDRGWIRRRAVARGAGQAAGGEQSREHDRAGRPEPDQQAALQVHAVRGRGGDRDADDGRPERRPEDVTELVL